MRSLSTPVFSWAAEGRELAKFANKRSEQHRSRSSAADPGAHHRNRKLVNFGALFILVKCFQHGTQPRNSCLPALFHTSVAAENLSLPSRGTQTKVEAWCADPRVDLRRAETARATLDSQIK